MEQFYSFEGGNRDTAIVEALISGKDELMSLLRNGGGLSYEIVLNAILPVFESGRLPEGRPLTIETASRLLSNFHGVDCQFLFFRGHSEGHSLRHDEGLRMDDIISKIIKKINSRRVFLERLSPEEKNSYFNRVLRLLSNGNLDLSAGIKPSDQDREIGVRIVSMIISKGASFDHLDEFIKMLREIRVDSIQASIINMLQEGNINFAPTTYFQSKQEDVSIGKSFVEAIMQIPEFAQDFRDWIRMFASIESSEIATLPHPFVEMVRYFSSKGKREQDMCYCIKTMYRTELGREEIQKIFRAEMTNNHTADRTHYAELDRRAINLLLEREIDSPGWLELAFSQGVVASGTCRRLKAGGVRPLFMTSDIMNPSSLHAKEGGIGAVAGEDPFTIIPVTSSSQIAEARAVVEEFMRSKDHAGFVRGNYHDPGFAERILEEWARITDGRPIKVVSCTGTIPGDQASFMNMLRILTSQSEEGLLILGSNTTSLIYLVKNLGNGQIAIKVLAASIKVGDRQDFIL